MQSINQIIAKIQTVGNAHGQINSVFVGPRYDVAADAGIEQYPLMLVMPDGFEMDFEGRTIRYRFMMAIMDREALDRSNQIEVLSDTAQMLMDICNKLHYDYRATDFILNVNDTAEPFVGDDTDIVAGHAINLTIEVLYQRDACAFPA